MSIVRVVHFALNILDSVFDIGETVFIRFILHHIYVITYSIGVFSAMISSKQEVGDYLQIWEHGHGLKLVMAVILGLGNVGW